jgi:hypothetical protein
MSKDQGATATAEKPAEVAPISTEQAQQVLVNERAARMEAATKEINAVLEKYGMDLRVNQVVQLSFKQ